MTEFRKVDPEQLLERLGITYEHRGDTVWASCPHPDHDDRTPSWRVIVDEDSSNFAQHRCYGCGWGGWPVHLVETVLGCTRKEAAAWLRDVEKDPPLPFEVNVEYQRSLKSVFTLPPGVQRKPLREWPEDARRYINQRKIADWQIERWRIGFADGRYHEELNPLAGRIVFPVRNIAGKLLGYTGRAYNGSKRRYKEPSKREGADLGAVFGEQYWPKKRKVVAVTEGAIDALAIERKFPALPVGGIYGSQLLEGHIARLSTFEHVLMCTDPDKAGNRVASELEERLTRWVNVIRVEFPEGEDAASLAVTSPQVLYDALSSALSVVHVDRNRSNVAPRPRGRRCRVASRVGRVGR